MAEMTQEHETTPHDSTSEQPTVRRPHWELAECTCPDWCERDHETD
ncbi:MAG: hypothetical protein M3P41_12185 [Actinomycetota bacterium]|nr:hypothetical protein [Actinomycetota bacterium]